MKRFLTLLAVAAIAGVTYVAAAPGSSLHAGPTWKQFSALQKQVASLKKQVGQANKAATDADGFVKNCLQTAAPVGLFGDVPDLAIGATQTYGFHYVASAGGAEGYSAAFSLDTSASPQAYFLEVDPTCVNQSAAAHAASQLMFRAKRTP